MASLNSVNLIGNVGKDPKITTTQSGKDVASFSVACSESWFNKKNNERETNTQWFSVVVYNDSIVDVIKKYVTKGSKVYVSGSLASRKWTDSNGVERYVTEVVLQAFNGKLILLDGKEEEKAPATKQASLIDDEDDLPPF